ncbi:uncharacterized protein [Nicotiana tomentosiformis]|uniref:uncharacterized protein n=1 Tax=Nicotiana tomentosiformis TaxID=4098 RepID=UPI00388CD984
MEHRMWMYDRNLPNRRGLRDEFVQGVDEFINHAKSFSQNKRMIRCPCAKYKCRKWLKLEDVKTDLYSKGFMDNYYVWTSHGEIGGSDGNIYDHNFDIGESSQDSRLHEMVMNAFGMYNEGDNQQYIDQAPNEKANHFYAQLESASRPLCDGMSHSKLSVATRLLSIKSDASVSQAGMDSMIELMKELNLNLDIPDNYYKAKRLASKGIHSAYLATIEQRCMFGRTTSRPSPESPSSEATSSLRISRLNIRASSSEASPTPSTPSSVHGPNPPPPGHVDLPPPGHADGINRICIIAKGEGFYPSRPAANAISTVIKLIYNGAYPTWGHIPHSQQQEILNEFMKRCTWSPDEDHVIRENFQKRIAHRLSDMFSDTRTKGKMHGWILPDEWKELLKYWATKDVKKKSEQAKAARNSEKGGSLHTCGSVSMGTAKRILVII